MLLTMYWKCCQSKVFDHFVCVGCHSVMHRSCLQRMKSVSRIKENLVNCCQFQDSIQDGMECDVLKEMLQERELELRRKDEYIKKLISRIEAIEEDALEMESGLEIQLKDKNTEIKELMEIVQKYRKKSQDMAHMTCCELDGQELDKDIEIKSRIPLKQKQPMSVDGFDNEENCDQNKIEDVKQRYARAGRKDKRFLFGDSANFYTLQKINNKEICKLRKQVQSLKAEVNSMVTCREPVCDESEDDHELPQVGADNNTCGIEEECRGSIFYLVDHVGELGDRLQEWYGDRYRVIVKLFDGSTSGVVEYIRKNTQLFKEGDMFILDVGANDTNPYGMSWNLGCVIEMLSGYRVFLMPVIRNRFLNEKMLNDLLRLSLRSLCGAGGVHWINILNDTKIEASVAFSVDCVLYDSTFIARQVGTLEAGGENEVGDGEKIEADLKSVQLRQMTLQECFRKQFFRTCAK